jgi:hypothetical protein
VAVKISVVNRSKVAGGTRIIESAPSRWDKGEEIQAANIKPIECDRTLVGFDEKGIVFDTTNASWAVVAPHPSRRAN